MDIADDEQLLFRTRAQVKLKEGLKEGEIVVTSSRLSFSTSSVSDTKNFTWSNIAGVKYSPANDAKGRAMVLLKTVIQGDEDVVITLIGPNKEHNFSQQEAMKSIISKIRKTGGKVPVNQKPSSVTSTTKRGPSSADLVDAKRRKQLLESDRYIAKQYRDLVEVNKILTDEDFWSVNVHQLQLVSDTSSTNQALSFKGKHNSLLAKSFDKDANGVININLTVEMRQNIFAMYPEVRKAFDAEVPLKRNETEFWTVYLQSEFYNGTSSSSSSDMPPQRDDLFARYSEKESSLGKNKKLNDVLQHSDVDLTASFGDYRAAEGVEAVDNNDKDASGDGTAALLLARYNRSSGIVVGDLAPSTRATASGRDKSKDAHSTGLSELLRHQEPPFIQVRFAERKTEHAAAVRANAPSLQSSTLSVLRLADAHCALRGLEASLPSEDRGSRLFAGAINLQKKVSARMVAAQSGKEPTTVLTSSSEQFNPLGMLGLAQDAAGKQLDDGSDEGNLLDEQFKQVM